MATGRPLRTEYDRTQNYKDYMKNLDLQIKNNKTNYDANILYKQTGVPTQPLDTRTYAEKHADIAQLKVVLRSELRTLLDDNVITQVFRELSDEQIQFLAGMAPALIAELKPKYSVGMTSHHFIDVLDKKVRQESDYSLQSEMLGTIADRLDTISDNMVTTELMKDLIDSVEHSKYIRSSENRQIVKFLNSINREIGQTQDLMEQISNIRSNEAEIAENYAKTAGQEAIHTQDILATMNDKILNFQALEELLRGVSIENAEMTQEALVEQFQHIPTKAQVERMIDVIQRADRLGDTERLDDVLKDIRDSFSTMGSKLENYNDELIQALNQTSTEQALAMSQNAKLLLQMRSGLQTDVGGLRENVGGLREDVGAMNMALSESIGDNTNELRGVKTSLDRVADNIVVVTGVVNGLTELYNNISRQLGLLGGLQGGQEQIRDILQSIERTLNIIQGQGEVSGTRLANLEMRINDINASILTTGLRPETIDEIQVTLTAIDENVRGLDLPESEYQRQRAIDKERPQIDFVPNDEFQKKTISFIKPYLRQLWNTGNPDLRAAMRVHFGMDFGKDAAGNTRKVLEIDGVTYTDSKSITKSNIEDIKRNYRFIAEEAKSVLSMKRGEEKAEVPIFAQPTEFAYKTPGKEERPLTEADFFEETATPQRSASATPKRSASAPPRSEGKGILTAHRGVGVRMTGRGVAPREKYIPLGKYLVNIHKLEHNNIVSFKSPNHKSTNIQSKRVSQPVADILLHIVNGTLDDIVTDNLNEDDISYLFQLIKKCELDNFLDGKAENKVKTKTEQEIHKFYVLQGEIVAGNDNPQLIKEFKGILLTMMNEGKLSKKEAGDVLIQMSLLGI